MSEWSWKVEGPQSNEELGLLYEPGTWGDVVKGAWAAIVARALVSSGRAPLRYLDPFAGAATYPLVEAAARRLHSVRDLELLELLEPHLRTGRFPSTALIVQAAASAAGADCELQVFDANPARRKTWRDRTACTLLGVASGDDALGTEADLALVDPYDLFERADQLLPLALGGDGAVLFYVFNKSPRGVSLHRRYTEIRKHLSALATGRATLVGRIPSDAALPRAFHELILVAPQDLVDTVQVDLRAVTLRLSRHLSDLGAFESQTS